MNLDQALKRIEELENELEQSKSQFNKEQGRLIELIIAWKRKAENKGIRRKSLREGYNANSGMHYEFYEIELPGSLPITSVLDYLKENDLKDLYPYTLRKIDYIPRKESWIYEVELDLNYDLQLEEDFLKKYYEKIVKSTN